jgi:hypothetical protein
MPQFFAPCSAEGAGAKAIRFSTLDAICRQFGRQPGDLLTFIADVAPADEKPATDAL